MLTSKEFEILLQKPESTILDFKQELYSFKNADGLSKFVKDVISFTNTIRNEKAYIIFGVNELEGRPNELLGIKEGIDDAILQDKLKNKVIPRPSFLFYTLQFNQKLFGIMEFPLGNYQFPIVSSVKLKGIEVSKVYYRNGTANTEATGLDVIRIYEWFKTLGSKINEETLIDKVSYLLKRLVSKEVKLSVVILEILEIAKIYGLLDLEKFCLEQFKGIHTPELDKHKYRMQKIIVSLNTIQVNPCSNVKISTDLMKNEMLEMEGFFEREIMFNQSIAKIEENLENFRNNPKMTYGTMQLISKQFMDTKKEYPIYCFFFYNNINGVYTNIRQKAIDELMKVQ